jgi:sugar lactone lactonase YvrE
MQFFRRFTLLLTIHCCLFGASCLPAQVFVGDKTGNISAYSSSGMLLDPSFAGGTFWSFALAADNNHLYAADIAGQGAARTIVSKYTLSGSLVSASLLSGPGHNYPTALAVDRQDRLFLGLLDGTVWAYDTAGQPVGTSPVTALNSVIGGLVSGPNGNLYATSGAGRVTEFTPNGLIVNDWTFPSLGYPGGLVIENGFIYALAQSGQLSQITMDGVMVNSSVISGLNDPRGITSDGQGQIFIALGFENRVAQYSATGQLLNPSFISGLNYPTSIVFVPEPNAASLAALSLLTLIGLRMGRRS